MTTHLIASTVLALATSLGLGALVTLPATPEATRSANTADVVSPIVDQEVTNTNDDAWRSRALDAMADAASSCGVVAIKNAPASIVVSYDASGKVLHATSESSLFGGNDTDACLRNELASLTTRASSEPRHDSSRALVARPPLTQSRLNTSARTRKRREHQT